MLCKQKKVHLTKHKQHIKTEIDKLYKDAMFLMHLHVLNELNWVKIAEIHMVLYSDKALWLKTAIY